MDDLKELVQRACDPQEAKAMAAELQQHVMASPRIVLYGLLVAVTLIWASVVFLRRSKLRKVAARPRTPDVEKKGMFTEPTKSKFAMAEPGGRVPTCSFCPHLFIDNRRSMDAIGLQAPRSTTVSRLVP